MTTTSYAVGGGGIVGASVAYHRSERTDDPVVVYERDGLATETMFKSTSMVGVGGPDPHYRMKQYGFRLYNDFLADPESDAEYTQSGRLRVAVDDENAARLKRLDAGGPVDADAPAESDVEWRGVDARKSAHDLTTYVPGDELRETLVVPPLDTDAVAGALYRPITDTSGVTTGRSGPGSWRSSSSSAPGTTASPSRRRPR